MSIELTSAPEHIARQIVPNLQLSPEIRKQIGGIDQQYAWVTEIIRAVFSEIGD